MPTKQVDPSQQVYKSRSALVIDNIVGGIGWGVGSIVGASAVVYLIGVFITRSQNIPFLSSLIDIVSKQVGQ